MLEGHNLGVYKIEKWVNYVIVMQNSYVLHVIEEYAEQKILKAFK